MWHRRKLWAHRCSRWSGDPDVEAYRVVWRKGRACAASHGKPHGPTLTHCRRRRRRVQSLETLTEDRGPAPNFLNSPTLLQRTRTGVEQSLRALTQLGGLLWRPACAPRDKPKFTGHRHCTGGILGTDHIIPRERTALLGRPARRVRANCRKPMPKTSLVSVVDDDRFFRESMRRLMRSLDYAAEAFLHPPVSPKRPASSPT